MKWWFSPILVILLLVPGCIYVTAPGAPDSTPSVGQPPTAYIDSIVPPNVSPGEMVSSTGHGTDPDGSVVGFQWRSSLDGNLSASASFDTSSLSAGTHTIYFKVQDNNGNWSSEVQKEIVISGVAPPLSPPPPAAGLPTINSFTANPPFISSGGTTTLNWNVSNATSVTIDPGPGIVDSIGTTSVAPATTTNYTVTASNSFGWKSLTIMVQVTGGAPPPSGQPDLVITNIERAETPTGYKINYTITNQGTADAGASTTKLYANGVNKTSDSVGLLAAGVSETKQFTGWVFNPTTPQIKVVADANTAVVESNETNNEKQTNYAIQITYDFVSNAGAAYVLWKSGIPSTNLSFGGAINDNNGFATYRTSIKMEDGASYAKVLETHPKWVDDGYIYGYYPIAHEIKPGEHFVAKVGLLQNAVNGKVRFEISYREVGSVGPETLIKFLNDSYNGQVQTIDVLFPSDTFGKKVNFYLRVRANGSSGQDWAAWVEARIIR